MTKVLAGFYYGIGDLIAVFPVLQELAKEKKFHFYIAVGEQNRALESILNHEHITFVYFPIFSFKKIFSSISFVRTIAKISPQVVTLSPHVANISTSWKLPLLLYILKRFGYIRHIIGSLGERNAALFSRRIETDKTLPLGLREHDFFRKIGFLDTSVYPSERTTFTIFSKSQKQHQIAIHPGASKTLKQWPLKSYVDLCYQIINEYPELHIKFIGLPHELAPLKKSIPLQQVSFESNKLEETIKILLHVKAAIVLDSAFAHICAALEIPTIALYGPTDPKLYAPQNSSTAVVHHNKLKCQYCNALQCTETHNICMELITPKEICEHLKELL